MWKKFKYSLICEQTEKYTPKLLILSCFSWHRIAYSVFNKTVTLYLDCQMVQTLDLLRGDNAVVSTEGVIVFGTRLLDEEVFEVRDYET